MTKFEKFQRILIFFLTAVFFFYVGNYVGKRGYFVEIKKNPPEIQILDKSPPTPKVDFSLFWQVWDLVSTQYLDRPVDPEKLMYGAIKGMVAALDDPYTSFLSPVVNKTVSNALNGTYEGIGAELDVKDGQLIIVAPLDGSPAKEAGVKSGDKILEIEGEITSGLTLTEAVSKIRGNAGTVSTLKLQRDGVPEPFIVRIKRGAIVVKSVTWEDKGNGTAYIRVSRFGAETTAEWDSAVKELNVKMNDISAIIVDVRGNPGGYLEAAKYIAGDFFRNKVVLWQEDALGVQTPSKTTRVGVFENMPVYVLIDGGSASASEILAAALKSGSHATLVGVKSFGKGTIQDARDFPDGSGIHLTIAKWLTPDKIWIHGKGIEPDVKVEETPDDFAKGADKQLDKAIELAKTAAVK